MKNVVGPNRSIRKEAVHRLVFLLEDPENRIHFINANSSKRTRLMFKGFSVPPPLGNTADKRRATSRPHQSRLQLAKFKMTLTERLFS